MLIEVFLDGICVIEIESPAVRAHRFVIRSEYDCFLRYAVVCPFVFVLPYINKELVAATILITVMTPKKLRFDDVFELADGVDDRNVDSIYLFSLGIQFIVNKCFAYPLA